MKSLIILLAIVIEYSSAQSTVALYGQCGGWDSAKNAAWTLPCDSGIHFCYLILSNQIQIQVKER